MSHSSGVDLEKYRMILENTNDAVAIYKAINGGGDFVLRFSNSAFERMVGVNKDELIGQRVTAVFPWIDESRLLDVFSRVWRTGEADNYNGSFNRDEKSSQRSYIVKLPTGEIASIRMDKPSQKASGEELLEERYRLLAENSSDVIFIQDMDRNFKYVSPSIEPQFGYTPEEVLGLSIGDLMTAESFERAGDTFEEAKSMAEKETDFEVPLMQYEYVRKDGSTFWGELNVKFLRDPLGYLVGFQGTMRDVTKRRRIEEERDEALRHFRTLFNLTVDPLVIVDPNGVVLEVTDRIEEVIGYQRDEIVDRSVNELPFITPDSLETLLSNLGKRLEGVEIPPYMVKLVTKSGEIRHFEVKAKKISYHGEPAVMAAFRDITERKRYEESLRESISRFQSIVGSAKDAIITVDNQGMINLWNDSAERIFGYSSEEMVGKPITLIMPERGRERFLEGYKRYPRTEEMPSFERPEEFLAIRKNGSRIPVEMTLSTYWVKGEPWFTAIIRDVTVRKLYERRLKALHRHANRLSSASSVEEIAEDTIQILRDVFGYHRASFSLVGDGMLRLVKADPYTTFGEVSLDGPGIVVHAVNSGKTQMVSDVRRDIDYIDAVPEGAPPTMSELAVPVKRGGRVIGVINIESEELDAFNGDDAELVETLAEHVSTNIGRIEAREREEDYERRLEALHKSASYLEEAGDVEEVSSMVVSTLRDVLGYNHGGIGWVDNGRVRYDTMRKDPSMGDWYLSLDESSITARALETGNTQLVHDTREETDYVKTPFKTVEVPEMLSELAVPVVVRDEAVAIINLEMPETEAFTEQDVQLVETLAMHVSSAISRIRRRETLEAEIAERTEKLREAYEELRELDRMKDQFMAMATHELRTPLTSIKGYIDYIQSGSVEDVPERMRELLYVVQRNTDRLKSLTDDLLVQQRLESGIMDIEKEDLQLSEVVREVMEEVEPMLAEKSQELEIHVPDEIPMIECDRITISQMLINLLDNAWKFSPNESTITLEITEEDDFLKVSIQDEGFGLSQDDIEKLFKPFPQIERPTVTEKSTGLGLSICKGIVELHGGEIWVESEGRKKGSTFYFTLPKKSDGERGEWKH
ncbi:MAG: PAS domain S-box protein [Candidatus Bathyarchaeia archaeon]